MTYKKIYMTFNIKRHMHARVIFSSVRANVDVADGHADIRASVVMIDDDNYDDADDGDFDDTLGESLCSRTVSRIPCKLLVLILPHPLRDSDSLTCTCMQTRRQLPVSARCQSLPVKRCLDFGDRIRPCHKTYKTRQHVVCNLAQIWRHLRPKECQCCRRLCLNKAHNRRQLSPLELQDTK